LKNYYEIAISSTPHDEGQVDSQLHLPVNGNLASMRIVPWLINKKNVSIDSGNIAKTSLDGAGQ
jgi:hypothetical protein